MVNVKEEPAPGCSTGELKAPASLVTVCASVSLFVQCTVAPALTVTTWGPKAKLWIATEFAATGAEVGGAAGVGMPAMLEPEGIAVGSAAGGPGVPGKPGSCRPLAGVMAAAAEAPLPPHAVSRTVVAAAAADIAAHQRCRFQRR